MRKFSLLLGTLGGAMAGYLLSNDKLRNDLSKAKDPEAAAKLLATHLAKDGKQLGHEVKKFAESEHVQKNIKQFSKYAKDKASEAQKGLETMMKKGGKSGGKMMKDGAKKMKSMMGGAKKTAATKAKKAASAMKDAK